MYFVTSPILVLSRRSLFCSQSAKPHSNMADILGKTLDHILVEKWH